MYGGRAEANTETHTQPKVRANGKETEADAGVLPEAVTNGGSLRIEEADLKEGMAEGQAQPHRSMSTSSPMKEKVGLRQEGGGGDTGCQPETPIVAGRWCCG